MTTSYQPLIGKIALVTGASRGIGRATALRLARDGALVAVHFANQEKAAKETVAAIDEHGGQAFSIQAELSTLNGVQRLLERLDQELTVRTRDNRFDILVNNAATLTNGGLDEITEETFDQMFNVNVKAPFFLSQLAVDRIRDNGRIINLSTILTRVANPTTIPYAMTKGAIDILTLNLAQSLGPRGITVNSVAPGATRTEMNSILKTEEGQESISRGTALGRFGQPADLADVIALLVSDDSRWVTGQLIEASGGYAL